jgi:structural maintenance of chromosome 3 (chondroitin sulfate proteoglycan 6)
MKAQNGVIDQQITSVMSEMQRLEAKKANLERSLTFMDEDVISHNSRIESKQKQMEQIVNEVIPPIERDIECLSNQVKSLEDEVGTELCEFLSTDEKNLLLQLKSVHLELEKDIEIQTQVLEEVSVARQRLQSLLEDNLLKRKKELEEEGSEAIDRRRSSEKRQVGSRLAQMQRQEDFEQVKRELAEAIQNAESVEERLSEAKRTDEALRAELMDGKKQLDAFKTKDVEIAKLLEDAQKREEKLMNKVSHPFLSNVNILFLASQIFACRDHFV